MLRHSESIRRICDDKCSYRRTKNFISQSWQDASTPRGVVTPPVRNEGTPVCVQLESGAHSAGRNRFLRHARFVLPSPIFSCFSPSFTQKKFRSSLTRRWSWTEISSRAKDLLHPWRSLCRYGNLMRCGLSRPCRANTVFEDLIIYPAIAIASDVPRQPARGPYLVPNRPRAAN